MIALNEDQQLVAETTAELARKLMNDYRVYIFLQRFPFEGEINEFLVGAALVIENQVKLAGGWDELNVGYGAFAGDVTNYIMENMHEHGQLGTAFLRDITRFVQEMIDSQEADNDTEANTG